jgi:4-amino-4-deoxy-L-arabinose transferase-like glycosyltransferase
MTPPDRLHRCIQDPMSSLDTDKLDRGKLDRGKLDRDKLDRGNVKRYLFAILAIAFAVRIGAALYLGDTVSGLSGAHDEISYSMLGQRFAAGYGMTFPEAWYPWIEADAPQSYFSFTISLYLAGIYYVVGYHPLVARLLMAVMSTLLVWLLYLIGRRLFSVEVGLVAGAIASLYAYLIFYGVTLVTETPFTLALLLALYLAIRIQKGEMKGNGVWLLLGVALAIAVLLRMAVLFFVPILLGWLYFGVRRYTTPRRLAIPLLVIALAIVPLTLRNYQLWHHFLLLEAQFGHVFWNGNHPGHLGNFHPYKVFPIPPEVLAAQNDVVITNTLLRMGIRTVLAQPGDFGLLTLTRLREFFLFWPTAESTLASNLLRLCSFGLILPFALYGLLVNLRRLQTLAPIYLLILVHTAIYAVTWTMIRYRTPLDPFFILFAADTLYRFYQYVVEPRTPALRMQQPTAE